MHTPTSSDPAPTRQFSVDKLNVEVYADRNSMGQAAAEYVAAHLGDLLKTQAEVRMVVGSAPSQDEFFAHLTGPRLREIVDWTRVVVFHMDEYIGLPADHPQNFRAYQRQNLLSKVDVKAFHEIRGEASDVEAECERLEKLLAERPIDVVCLGIGENGHLAFNDPPADFADTRRAKVVTLDHTCRQQQVNDGCFPSIDGVPTHAITLTLKVFQEANKLSGVVPARSKARAVVSTLEGPIAESCPATILRRHADATLFLDTDSASLLTDPR